MIRQILRVPMRRAPLLPCLTRYTRAFVRRPAAISASRHVRGHVIVFPLKITVGTPFPCDLPDIYFGLSIELSKVTLPSFHFLLWTYFFACLCFLRMSLRLLSHRKGYSEEGKSVEVYLSFICRGWILKKKKVILVVYVNSCFLIFSCNEVF